MHIGHSGGVTPSDPVADTGAETEINLEGKTKKELVNIALDKGIGGINTKTTKSQLIQLLEKA